MKTINFNNPSIKKYKKINLGKLERNLNYSTLGQYTKRCSDFLNQKLKSKSILMTKSCTAALEMSAILLNIKKNDEVIFPSFSYVSTVNSFVLRGARPIFIDIDKKNLCLDINLLEKKISKKTKAVVITNYAGGSCDLKRLLKLKKKYNFYLVEDGAQSLFSKYKKKYLGTFGDLSTLSFHQTKNIHCGEGGALIINNKKFVKRADIIFCKGTDRISFEKGKVKKYTWKDIGSSYAMSELHGIVLDQNLRDYKKIYAKRKKIWSYYHKNLKNLEYTKALRRPLFNKYINHNSHIYYILVKKKHRNNLIKFLKKNKINCTFHYQALHQSSFFIKNFSKKKIKLEISENTQDKILRLPLWNDMRINEAEYVVKKIYKYFS